MPKTVGGWLGLIGFLGILVFMFMGEIQSEEWMERHVIWITIEMFTSLALILLATTFPIESEDQDGGW